MRRIMYIYIWDSFWCFNDVGEEESEVVESHSR